MDDIDPLLVADLRRAFLDGETPSRLMQRLAEHHPHDPRLHHLIRDAFGVAFGVGLVRHVLNEIYEPDPRHAHFNSDLMPEMVAGSADLGIDVSGTWLDGVSVRSHRQHIDRLRDYCPPELARFWDTLDESERRYVRGLIASKDHSWQVMKLLAALAERLQVKLAAADAAAAQSSATASA